MVTTAHQAQLHLVLHILDVEGATTRTRPHQRAHDSFGQAVHRLTHAGRGSALGAMHREEGLHQGDCNLAGLERDHRAVAPDDLVGRVGRRGCEYGAAGGRGEKGFLAG